MNEIKINEIKPGCYFSKPVYLDKAFVLTAPEIPFSDEVVQLLVKWSFKKVYSEGEASAEYSKAGEDASSAPEEGISLSQQSDVDKLKKAEEFYKNFLFYVENMFVKASVSDELDEKAVTDKIKEITEYIKEDRRFFNESYKGNRTCRWEELPCYPFGTNNYTFDNIRHIP